MSEERINITHPNGQYDVIVGEALLDQLQRFVPAISTAAIVTDSNVGPLYAHTLSTPIITIPAGEQHKNLATVRTIYDKMLTLGLDRKATIIALGGGVVGDITGFVAATYMRGIDFVQCPTTLLAMVDASVGGKTGVDLPQGKNLIGAFKQPLAVIADLATLQSLPEAEFASGMAEVVKHGLIAGGDLWQKLSEWGHEGLHKQSQSLETQRPNLHSLIVEAIKVKQDVVISDPFEQGRRAILNLGHTFGHAIEQVSGYRLRHGEAVAIGLVAAANLSARLGSCAPELQTEIEGVLQSIPLPTRIPFDLDLEQVYGMMGSDKKKAAGKLRFVLPRSIGDIFVTSEADMRAVMATLSAVREVAASLGSDEDR